MAVQQPQTSRIQIIRRTWLILAAAVLLTACGKEDVPGYNPPKLAEQTVLLYMPGRSLMPFFEANLAGVRKGVNSGVPGRGRILVCWQPIDSGSAELSEVYYDTNRRKAATRVLKTYDSFDAGDPADVHQLLADAAATAPAKKYGLIIGCHGKAWVPASAGGLSPRSADKRPAADGHPEDSWEPMPGAKITRSFGDAGAELDITELADAISAQAFKPEYLVFDDCFMASVEVFYDLRNVVPCVVASPCEIMGAGFPYNRILPRLFADNGASFDLEKVCYEFWNLYMNDWQSLPIRSREQSGCISMAVMSQIDALAKVMQRVNAAPKKSYDPTRLQAYEGFTRHAFYDLQHYVELSCDDPALVEEFIAALDRAVPRASRLYTPNFYSVFNDRLNPVNHYSGITTSDPSVNSTVTPYIQQTAWYQATH